MLGLSVRLCLDEMDYAGSGWVQQCLLLQLKKKKKLKISIIYQMVLWHQTELQKY